MRLLGAVVIDGDVIQAMLGVVRLRAQVQALPFVSVLKVPDCRRAFRWLEPRIASQAVAAGIQVEVAQYFHGCHASTLSEVAA